MTYYVKYLLTMELRFDAILYSKLGDENSDAGHIICSRGLEVPNLWCKQYLGSKPWYCSHDRSFALSNFKILAPRITVYIKKLVNMAGFCK